MVGLSVDCSDTLTILARENGFTIHVVPGDSNCLFNAIAYQLEFVNANEMREIVANHLESNSVFYCNFLSQPVACNNAYNADTEAPTDEDAYIDSVNNRCNYDIISTSPTKWCMG